MIPLGRCLMVLAGAACLACTGQETERNAEHAAGSPPPAPAVGDSLFQSGKALYAEGLFDSARTIWLMALDRARAARDSGTEARLLTELGLAAYRLGEPLEAQARQDSAISLKTRLGLRHELARSFNALGLTALTQNRNAEAARYFEQSMEAAAAVGDAEGIAKATGNAALAYGNLGDLRRAREGHRALRKAGVAVRNAYYEGNGLSNEAMIDIAEGDPITAIARLDTARTIYRRAETGRTTGEQNAHIQLATAFEQTGDYERALASLDTALILARRQQQQEQEITSLRLLGGVHRRVGDHRRALRYYAQAESLVRATSVTSDLASTLRGAAESHALVGNLPRALASAEAALELHRESEEVLEQVDDLILLAELDHSAGQPAQATARLAAASRLSSAAPNRLTWNSVALARARHADLRRDGRGTLRALQLLDSTSRALDFQTQWSASALAARAYARLSRFDSAATEGARSVEALERLRGSLALEPMRLAIASERVDVYGEYILTLLRLGRQEAALQVADRARSRGLLEQLASIQRGDASPGIPGELVEGEALLRRIDALLQALRRTAPRRSPQDRTDSEDAGDADLIARLTSARSDYEALLARAVRRDARSSAVLGASAVVLTALRHALDSEEVLIEYFLTRDRLLLFAVTRDTLVALESEIAQHVLTQQIRLLRDRWSVPDAEWQSGLPVARALHGKLLQPLERIGILRPGARVVIVPHGLLGQVPFAALRNAQTERFVAEDFAISYAPSAAAFSAARQKPVASGGHDTRGYGFAPFPDELRASREEVEGFARSVSSAETSKGNRATERALRQALARRGIVHVASHGMLNTHNPMFSRIELARTRGTINPEDDGRLEVRELMALKVRNGLVFLSGCETGALEGWANGAVRGTGELTLSQAFLSAGADNVISTLWRIEDTHAGLFARYFYDELRNHSSAVALALAQRRTIGGKSVNPYYWASYILSGEGRFTLRPQEITKASVY